MKKFTIQNDEKPLAYLNLFTDFDSKADLLDRILDQITYDPDIGFAGFSHKDGLREHLKWQMGEIGHIGIIDESKIKVIIEKTIKKCLSVVNTTKPVHIFVFPTFSEFVREKMNGVTGYSPWRNTILVYVNPVQGWYTQITGTICHEFVHAVAQNYNELITILDQLIFDGIAEHFSEHVTGNKSMLGAALAEKEAKRIFHEIHSKLDSDDSPTRKEIFYGAGKYPMWAGYSIGYYIVGSFLKGQDKIDWNNILKTSPKNILEESRFLV